MTKERVGWAKAQRCPTSKASVGLRRLSPTYSANENCGLACDVAVWVTQEGQLIHGGWGYGEEYAISRYVVDALVLPIFEGVKPILELKVIARTLLA